jgi:cell division transport system permease protein
VLLASYAMAVLNLQRLSVIWGRASGMSCQLDEQLTLAGQHAVQQQLAHLDGVHTAELISPEMALARFAARSPEAAALVDGVDPHILPPTVALTLLAGGLEPDAVVHLAQQAQQVTGVTSIDTGGPERAQLQQWVHRLRLAGWSIGGLLAAGIVVLLSNSIRATVYARRDELAILQLVGATAWFVRLPFLLEGALWGLGGGLLGTGTLWGLHRLLAPRLSAALAHWTGGFELHLFVGGMALAQVVGGTLLGVCGSAVALRRFLDPAPRC